LLEHNFPSEDLPEEGNMVRFSLEEEIFFERLEAKANKLLARCRLELELDSCIE
jgi:hypothetical protein